MEQDMKVVIIMHDAVRTLDELTQLLQSIVLDDVIEMIFFKVY